MTGAKVSIVRRASAGASVEGWFLNTYRRNNLKEEIRSGCRVRAGQSESFEPVPVPITPEPKVATDSETSRGSSQPKSDQQPKSPTESAKSLEHLRVRPIRVSTPSFGYSPHAGVVDCGFLHSQSQLKILELHQVPHSCQSRQRSCCR